MEKVGARLPQGFIPAQKDYSGMGGASGAAGEGKADQGIANLIKKPPRSSRAVWLLLVLTFAEKSMWRFWVCWFCKGVLELH